MAGKTTIEWATDSWNPVRGCAIVSKGCTNCYAMRQAHRTNHPGGAYEGLTQLTKGGPVWTGHARTVPQLLDQPLRWRRPRRIFVNSMSDLFHDDVDVVFIASVLGIASACPQHTFQVLTKRPARMLEILQSEEFLDAYESSQAMHTHAEIPWPPPNVWLGVSVEDQATADERIPLLLQTPAAVRWISAEPLLGPISFEGCWVPYKNPAIHVNWLEAINWVVVGGESGPGARPMHPDWARLLRDQCAAVGTAFFFKQWGAWAPIDYVSATDGRHLVKLVFTEREKAIGGPAEGTTPCNVRRVGKKVAGRELDGRTHDEYPA